MLPHDGCVARHGWEEAPAGMMMRGKFKGKSKFIDSDGTLHAEFPYAFGETLSHFHAM